MTGIRRLAVLAALVLGGMCSRSVEAELLTISPTGSTGPGGTITFAQIGPQDLTSANLNTDFTALSFIPVIFTVSDTSPISIYGNDVNDTSTVWSGFTATVVSGTATFQDPNDPYNPYSTYSDMPGWTVSLANQNTTAIFSGGLDRARRFPRHVPGPDRVGPE